MVNFVNKRGKMQKCKTLIYIDFFYKKCVVYYYGELAKICPDAFCE